MKIMTWVLALLLGYTFISSKALASVKCEQIYFKQETQGRVLSPANSTLLEYQATSRKFQETLNKLPEVRARQIQHLLLASEFIDHQHFSAKIFGDFLNSKTPNFDFRNLYSRPGEPNGQVFDNFVEARTSLLSKQHEINADLLRDIHRIVMKNGIENVQPSQLGQLRDGHWIGNARGNTALKASEVTAVKENPYLTFTFEKQINSRLDEDYWKSLSVWGISNEYHQRFEPELLSEGKINYPNIRTSKQETIDLIKNQYPDLFNKITNLRSRISRGENLQYSKGSELSNTEVLFTQALTEQRINQFNIDRQALGQIKIGQNEKSYISLVADLQRDLVAIHPVLNGNGRTTRLLMNYLLQSEGLPSSRIHDPFVDIQVSKEEWREIVYRGVINSAKIQSDILYRIQNGLRIENSPELLYSGIYDKISIALKKQGSTKIKIASEKVDVDGNQFMAFVKELYRANPDLAQQLENDHLRTMNRLAELFIEYSRSKIIEYIHNKDGTNLLRLQLIDADFISTFGTVQATNSKIWQSKMNRWYDSKMLIWRGLSNRAEVSDSKILSYFTNLNLHMASNATVRKARGTPTEILTAMKQDFESYNQELINGKLLEMADDHHKEGPRYGTSYGFSTSKREIVGKAFAMGAMVIAEYGKQNDPELQKQLKSRINIASYRAAKDVDLGRLKAFDSNFSYIYGRQAEVMGIGGTDPDAVMLIQKIQADGSVEKTFYRNPENPSQILVISGRYLPEEGNVPTERILEKFMILRDINGTTQIRPTGDAAAQQQAAAIRPAEPVQPAQGPPPIQQARPEAENRNFFRRLLNL